MSDALSIVAITTALRNILLDTERGVTSDPELEDTLISTKSLDKARTNENTNQINIFLYHTGVNSAWRNMPIPGQVKSGESAVPPLPLNLYYLVTAFGRSGDELLSHRLLGKAARILYDNPKLTSSQLKFAMPDSKLYQQTEPIHITMQNFTIDEMHRLWTAFQAPYRPSMAYQIGVVLIESLRPTISALPVLESKRDTRKAPAVTSFVYSQHQNSAHVEESISVEGSGFTEAIIFQLWHVSTQKRFILQPQSISGTSFVVDLSQSNLLAGRYVSMVEGDNLRSGEYPFFIAPQISVFPPEKAGSGRWRLQIQSTPKISKEQRVSLFVGEREFLRELPTNDPLTFLIQDIAPGTYRLRLRVDGVDSWIIDPAESDPTLNGPQVTLS